MTRLDDKQKDYLSQTFNGLDMAGKEIRSREFDGCTFNDCDFSEVVFSECKFLDCHFLRSNLSVIKVDDSRFADVIFEECKVIGIDWTTAFWPQVELNSPIKFYKCIINDSTFLGLSLEEIVMQECKAHYVDFREGNFNGADFSYTDLSNSMFNKTLLAGANFTEAVNYTIDLYQNEIKGAKFSRYEAVRLLDSLDIELVD